MPAFSNRIFQNSESGGKLLDDNYLRKLRNTVAGTAVT